MLFRSPIPEHWAAISSLHLAVSVDGLPEEHDRRRKPATYDRILKHIQGQSPIIHCTITAPMLRRDTYLLDFADFWSRRPEVRKIWFSLFTPQQNEDCEERLTVADRHAAVRRSSQSSKNASQWRTVMPRCGSFGRSQQGFRRWICRALCSMDICGRRRHPKSASLPRARCVCLRT